MDTTRPTILPGARGWKVLALVAIVLATGLGAGDDSDQRARPPKWPQDVLSVFFADARQALVGTRPNYSASAPVAVASSGGPSSDGDEKSGSGYEWSKLVSADTIESEIKRQVQPLTPLVATPNAFKGGGYRDCRDRFTTLAVLFGVASDYDDTVRWQDSARGLSELFGRAGANCKVGTDQSFREAQLRVQDLSDLVRGSRPDVPKPTEKIKWDELADRSTLMRRMESTLNEQLAPGSNNASTFKKNGEDLAHEAQMMAVLAHVLIQDGLDDAGDETYDGYAKSLRDAAVSLSQAVDLETYDQARTAVSTMQKACSSCHDEYR